MNPPLLNFQKQKNSQRQVGHMSNEEIVAGIRGGINRYKEHDFTSIVEHLAIERAEAKERYERHLRESGERRKERLALSGRK